MISSPVWSTDGPPPTTATFSCACGYSSGEVESWEAAILEEYRHGFAGCPLRPEVDLEPITEPTQLELVL